MFASQTKRPRNVNTLQAAAILYGDWGTSKAYVLGLAFAFSGYSSFWLIVFVSCLVVLVGVNYITICKFYPTGGGVYASVRERSQVLSMLGAFFLIADYLVTASLSSLSAFSYIGVPNPALWATAAIILIGALNYFGPKNTGNIAFLIVIPTVITVFALAIFCIPFLPTAIHHIQPLKGSFLTIWVEFTGVIVALSGVEAIANTTGVMKLDKGTTEANPLVTKTSTPAILTVMLEVSIFTTLFALAMLALPGLEIVHGDVIAPDQENVRDSMLRYMAEKFSGNLLGPQFGAIFGWIVSLVFCVLLLSAVNTALVALVSLLFVISRDGEIPKFFEKLNGFGVPIYSLITAVCFSFLLVLTVADVAGLAELYAVGFVGAIATNLGSTATNFKLNLLWRERGLMFFTFIIMFAIEITLLITKPGARNFAIFIFAAGLLLRGLVQEGKQKKIKALAKKSTPRTYSISDDISQVPLHLGSMLCAVAHKGKTLEFALQECKKYKQPLFLLYVKEQQVITEEDRAKSWLEDENACEIFDYAKEELNEIMIRFVYSISDSTADSIMEIAKEFNVSRLILGMPRKNKFFQLLHGNVVQEVVKRLPDDIDLIVIC